ncbi:MAG TPA: type II secretion system protein GspL [Gammaproteobacteria bacterium]|jgi:general secretion pathway protein L|nr:type II secretion system protein GspL [Gammaproteobacteria bacterium]
MQKLIIYLGKQSDIQPSWVVLDDSLGVVSQVYQGDVGLLPSCPEETLAVVPAEDVLLTQINLPRMSHAKARQALPYALEDTLLDDIERLHFAWVQGADGQAVAVVAHEKMQQWLSQLASWGVVPDRLVSSIFLLPVVSAAWSAVRCEGILLRREQYQGMYCDEANFALFSEAQGMDCSLEKVQAADFLAMYAKNLFLYPAINLLQGRYRNKRVTSFHEKLMKKAVIALSAGVVALCCFSPMMSYLLLSHREAIVESEIKAIYQRHFPMATAVVAPKLRMQEKLRQFSLGHQGDDLLLLLGEVSQSLSSTHVSMKRIDFQGGALTVDLTAVDPENISDFIREMESKGFVLKQKNAVLLAGRMNVTVNVSRSG